MDAKHTDYGLRVGPADVRVLYTDDKLGAWLLIETYHDAVEVRITPKGRKVTAEKSDLRLTRGDA
jgi:hypothetical protein